jgi:hypothetical protein
MSSRLFFLSVVLVSYGISTQTWARAQAHNKTDIITLYNGDRLTGELLSMYGGIVSLKTDALGTAKIEWKRVSQIESVYHYDIRLSSGERHFAAIGNTAITGQLKVIFDNDEHSFEMLEIVEIRPVENSFLARIDLYLSAGYSYTQASSVAQASFNTQISYEDENTRNTFSGRTTHTDTADDITSSSKLDLSRQVWTDRSKSYRTFYGRYESNDELALEGRYTLGAGLGRYFIDTQKIRWIGSAGLQVITEKQTVGTGEQCDADGEPAGCVEAGDRRDSIEAFFSTEFAAWRFDTPELDLDLKFNVYPSLSESGRVRADTDIRIRWELIEDLYWDLTTFITYDNKAGIDHEVDYGITTGIGWTY